MIRLDQINSAATLEAIIGVDPAIIRGYAKGVADELGKGPLTLDRRDRLLGRGKHLGLGRFEAALVLAVVERMQPAIPQPAPAKIVYQRARSGFRWTTLATACTTQIAIAAAAWWLIF